MMTRCSDSRMSRLTSAMSRLIPAISCLVARCSVQFGLLVGDDLRLSFRHSRRDEALDVFMGVEGERGHETSLLEKTNTFNLRPFVLTGKVWLGLPEPCEPTPIRRCSGLGGRQQRRQLGILLPQVIPFSFDLLQKLAHQFNTGL